MSDSNRPLKTALFIAVALFAMGVIVPLTTVPPSALLVGTVLVSVLFVVLPIFLLFYLASSRIATKVTVIQFVIGAGAAVLCGYWLRRAGVPLEIASAGAASQLSVIAWSGALGTLVALLFKDKNLVLPAAAVLASIDLVIVLTPSGIVQQALQSDQGRKVFEAVAYHVPSLGRLQPAAFVGPADFLFVSMFFCVIHRHEMNKKATLVATAGALAVYLLVVLLFGDFSIGNIPLRALPALVPIGAAVLAVNWKQFKLSRDERIMTAVVALICAAFVVVSFVKGSQKRDVPGPKAPQVSSPSPK
ncbi:MAG: hypothetical protein U0R49_11380 [Fimbriimonadales bacterium]